MRTTLARLIAKLTDERLAERLEACTDATCTDAELVKLLNAEADDRGRKDRKQARAHRAA